MSRISILPGDNMIVEDGVPRYVDETTDPKTQPDLSAMRAAGIHAVQWQDVAGVVEHVRPAPEPITSLEPWAAELASVGIAVPPPVTPLRKLEAFLADNPDVVPLVIVKG